MIVSKLIINGVATKLAKHFSLDKMMAYVFDENDLDKKIREHEVRLNLLEKTSHPPKNFKCKCDKEK
tara:strand:+ start:1261 stop:1461 length:201 start_codon:yes stop_codon:yes gene_type:complete